MASESKVLLFKEVAEHTKKGDCWLIISGKVYDVSAFLDDHPGGDDVLLNATAKDATQEFEEVGHTADAKETMEKYYIGEVDLSSFPAKEVAAPPPPSSPDGEGSGLVFRLLQLLVPLLMLAVAVYWNSAGKE